MGPGEVSVEASKYQVDRMINFVGNKFKSSNAKSA